jgi:hypothetical protein
MLAAAGCKAVALHNLHQSQFLAEQTALMVHMMLAEVQVRS